GVAQRERKESAPLQRADQIHREDILVVRRVDRDKHDRPRAQVGDHELLYRGRFRSEVLRRAIFPHEAVLQPAIPRAQWPAETAMFASGNVIERERYLSGGNRHRLDQAQGTEQLSGSAIAVLEYRVVAGIET